MLFGQRRSRLPSLLGGALQQSDAASGAEAGLVTHSILGPCFQMESFNMHGLQCWRILCFSPCSQQTGRNGRALPKFSKTSLGQNFWTKLASMVNKSLSSLDSTQVKDLGTRGLTNVQRPSSWHSSHVFGTTPRSTRNWECTNPLLHFVQLIVFSDSWDFFMQGSHITN